MASRNKRTRARPVLGRPVPGPLLPEDGQPWTSCALFGVACHSIPGAVPCGSHLAPPDVCLAPCSTAAPGKYTSCTTVCVAARYPTTGVCGSDATTSVSFCLSCVSAMLCLLWTDSAILAQWRTTGRSYKSGSSGALVCCLPRRLGRCAPLRRSFSRQPRGCTVFWLLQRYVSCPSPASGCRTNVCSGRPTSET